MCGICGKLNLDRDDAVSEPLIRAMTRTMAHRGPDGEGVYVTGVHRSGTSPAGHH